jgi:hypothetical protein
MVLLGSLVSEARLDAAITYKSAIEVWLVQEEKGGHPPVRAEPPIP